MVDIQLHLAAFPEPGGVTTARRAIVTPGAGYNLLAGAARLGLPAAYAGLVGTGPFGSMVRRALAAQGIPVLLPPREDEDTGFDVGLVQAGADSQPTFIGWPGAESRITLADLRSVRLADGDAVYVSGYDLWYPDAGAALTEWISELGAARLLVFDPGPLAGEIEPGRLGTAIGRADILSLNVLEAAMVAGGDDRAGLAGAGAGPGALAGALARRTRADGWVIVRAGADGCWVAGQDTPARHLAARRAAVVDPTGAGDIHVAALVARLAAGQGILEAARWANVAASLAVERTGPDAGPTATELAEAAGPDSACE
jgi:sugar/nucleoside kinase (ribokinase family)